MNEFLAMSVSAPVLPATVLLALVCFYWLLVMLGSLDLDFLDVDLEFDLDAEPSSLTSVGFVVLRFLNIGNVPVMIWGSVFALTLWVVSSLLFVYHDASSMQGESWPILQIVLRNVAISVFLTKLFTTPLVGKFDPAEPDTAEDLVGRECVITTLEATVASGQASVSAVAAPHLLNVRTADGTLSKGDSAEIIDYDREKRVYIVARRPSGE